MAKALCILENATTCEMAILRLKNDLKICEEAWSCEWELCEWKLATELVSWLFWPHPSGSKNGITFYRQRQRFSSNCLAYSGPEIYYSDHMNSGRIFLCWTIHAYRGWSSCTSWFGFVWPKSHCSFHAVMNWSRKAVKVDYRMFWSSRHPSTADNSHARIHTWK